MGEILIPKTTFEIPWKEATFTMPRNSNLTVTQAREFVRPMTGLFVYRFALNRSHKMESDEIKAEFLLAFEPINLETQDFVEACHTSPEPVEKMRSPEMLGTYISLRQKVYDVNPNRQQPRVVGYDKEVMQLMLELPMITTAEYQAYLKQVEPRPSSRGDGFYIPTSMGRRATRSHKFR